MLVFFHRVKDIFVNMVQIVAINICAHFPSDGKFNPLFVSLSPNVHAGSVLFAETDLCKPPQQLAL